MSVNAFNLKNESMHFKGVYVMYALKTDKGIENEFTIYQEVA